MNAAPARSSTLHIGDVAARVGLSLRTVRYYEEQGLIEPAGRTDGGFRLYGDEQVERLQLIKQMKPLGFTVQQMCRLLHALDHIDDADAGRRSAARDGLAAFTDDVAARCDELAAKLGRGREFHGALAARLHGA